MNTSQKLNACTITDLGLINYQDAYRIQQDFVERVIAGKEQKLILCEHPPVLTLGRLADEKNFLVSQEMIKQKGVTIQYINRGGDITLHSPGQLVIYPILNLVQYGKDLRAYLHKLEQVAIDLLGGFDIVANRFPGQTGVWVGDNKIVSIGIGVKKWVSFHGLAINVNTQLDLFSLIRPCGLDVKMTSISEIKKEEIDMKIVKDKLLEVFKENFSLNIK